jgi:nicotinamide phosphoribosyltransferase
MNPILLTDSYKITHWKQYPPKTTNVYSYFESRGGYFSHSLFFGLQYIIKKYLMKPITMNDILEAQNIVQDHMGHGLFNFKGWDHILKEHGGRLPVSIRAVPEGTLHPVHTPLITVENTDPECFWLTNYIESLLVQVWYPITVATLSYRIKELILLYLEKTGTPETAGVRLHDFGFRGVSSVESSGIGGLAHLVNFGGTDTLQALIAARDYYNEPFAVGKSIPAAEHSTITSWGQEHEIDAYKNMIDQFGDKPYAVVSDSFNIFKACEMWGTDLKQAVLDKGGNLIVRPDSGNPMNVIPQVLRILGDAFGVTKNTKGFKVLNDAVRIIWGDGLNLEAISNILFKMAHEGWSADNIAFGMGGGLLQNLNRDTMRFAFKCSSVIVDGQERDVFKNPITDLGKVSKKGRFEGLTEVYRDGRLLVDDDLSTVQARLNVRSGGLT